MKTNKDNIQCATCLHIKVCRLKDEFEEAQTSIDNMTIYGSDEGDNKIALTSLKDIPFIKPVYLECNFYYSNQYLMKRDLSL